MDRPLRIVYLDGSLGHECRKAKEEVPCDSLSTNAREYFTRTNLVKTKNSITYEP